MNPSNPETNTRIAMLGTMAEIHQEIPAYDLRVLQRLVKYKVTALRFPKPKAYNDETLPIQ